MSDDRNKITSHPFCYDHHTILSEGFPFPNNSNFDPFMYNHQQQQNPTEFDSHYSFSNFLRGAVEYNTLSAAAGNSTTSGGATSYSSQEAGAEEDSSKSKKDVREEGDGKSKNVRGKGKQEKKLKQERLAFMTKSDVDNLEDGYRWRKYGQKAVKNSSFPRSYYRCTNQKCGVKKRIERSYQDPTVVITTYEGQHNHHSPAAVMLAPSPAFPRGVFYPARDHRNQTNPTTFYTERIDSNHHNRRQSDIGSFFIAGRAAGSSFVNKPEP